MIHLFDRQHIQVFREKLQQVEHPHHINVNEAHAEFKTRLGLNGRVATVLTAIYGSMWFVYLLVLSVAGWMLLQAYLGKQAFDPYPYALCLFIGNLIQLLGGPTIQVGQNLSSAHSELRAESDYQVNQASFDKLEKMDENIIAILAKLEGGNTGGQNTAPLPQQQP